jgi:hypothetical protein
MPIGVYKRTKEHIENQRKAMLLKLYGRVLSEEEQKKLLYERNKEANIKSVKNWKKKNWNKVLAINARWNKKIRFEVLENYGELFCRYCGEPDKRLLSLDHVNGDGKEHRKKIGVRSGTGFYCYLKKHGYPNDPPLHILCKSCNSKKQ